MKGSTILLIVVVLWFLSTQVNKITTSANNVAKSTKGVGDLGTAGASLITAGANALGKWASSSSASPSAYDPYSDPSYMGANYTPSTASQNAQAATNYANESDLPAGVYGPAVPAAWSDDLATPDWSN